MVYEKFRDKSKMHSLATAINTGYSCNFRSVQVMFKKKYLFVLKKLVQYNCIVNYTVIQNNVIKIRLKYYNNKPLFKIMICSTNANKKWLKIHRIIKVRNFNSFNLHMFSTTAGILCMDEVLYLHNGGNLLLKFEFLHQNAISR